MTAHRSARHLPAYALYGEAASAALDPLHCEAIAQRSRLHGWEIGPHRHGTLFQLIVVHRGAADALLDGRRLRLSGPAVITVPALAAHGFRFTPAVDGQVFTVAEAHLSALLAPHAGVLQALLQLHGAGLPPADRAAVAAAARALQGEALGQGAWRRAALDAALLRLAVAVARSRLAGVPAGSAEGPAATAAAAAAAAPRAVLHVQRLRALVEAQFRQQPGQAALAAQLGLTSTQLNRACQQVLGHAAQGVLHARLVLQAQRELAYTDLAVKHVALELGFADAAYFTRFFSRHTGLPPAAWRARQRLS